MSVCFSQDPIYFLSATVAAALQCCCFRGWCNYLWPWCMQKAFDCNIFYHTTKIMSDQKVRRAITKMVRLPYYFSTITATLHSWCRGLVRHLALRNECFPAHPLLPPLSLLILDFIQFNPFFFPFVLYLISIPEPCLFSTFFSILSYLWLCPV